jgi:sulfite exporter TauE/SafE/copper chaperone CopZ
MENNLVKEEFGVKELKCEGCPYVIKGQAMKVDGVKEAGFDYNTRKGYVIYDKTKADLGIILDAIEEKGYTCFLPEVAKTALAQEKTETERRGFAIENVSGNGSEGLIRKQAMKVEGVKTLEYDTESHEGYVTFDPEKTDIDTILYKIEERGYKCFILDGPEDGASDESLDESEERSSGRFSDMREEQAIPNRAEQSARPDSRLETVEFRAKGTTCHSCEEIIKRQARKADGVSMVEFDYATETGKVTFDPRKTDINRIFRLIEKKGYSCSTGSNQNSNGWKKTIGWIAGIIGILIAGYFLFGLVDGIQMPQISQNMSYGLLLIVGLLTGFHCIAMCGGFVVGYTSKDAQEGRSSHKSHLMYAAGKTLSYTLIGAAFGLLGSIITFTPAMRGIAGLIAGLFLIVFGLNMLNIFPWLRKFQLRTPAFISRFVGSKSKSTSSPLVIGLLNGLMIACGPLQAIYIMAAGTGSMIEGAKLLFIFALGTLPVMLAFGYFASFISRKMTQTLLKMSGAVVIVLGLIMLNNGLVLTGSGFDFRSIVDSVRAGPLPSAAASAGSAGGQVATAAGGNNAGNTATATATANNVAVLKDGYQEIHMDVIKSGFSPNKFVLKKGVPVKWIIDGKELTGCNSGIQVPAYNLKFQIQQGTQTIEFTPTESGTIRWSCWMGMIPGTFIVQDDISDTASAQKAAAAVAVPAGGSCGGASGGGCGCMG